MRLDRFDLNLLVVLDALLEERNVTRASRRLSIGQSGASAALARLREYFGDELLVPVGRQLALTPLARSLVDPVREALMQSRAAISRRPGFDPATTERHFTLCASDYVMTVMLARALQFVAARAPGLSFDLRGPPRDLADAFERGAIDLLLIPQQYAERLGQPMVRLFEDTHVCLVSADHPEVGDRIDFDTYIRLGHVAVRLGEDRSVSFEEWFLPRYGRQRRVECGVDSFTAVPLLVAGTRRVATLHGRLARHFAQTLSLRVLPTPFEMPPLVETMVWPRHLQDDPAHAWLREQLQACADAMDASPPAV